MNNSEELSEKSNPEKKEKVCNRNIKDILQLSLFSFLFYDKNYLSGLVPPKFALQGRIL